MYMQSLLILDIRTRNGCSVSNILTVLGSSVVDLKTGHHFT